MDVVYRKVLLFLNILFIYFGGEGKGRRKREKHQCLVASCMPPTGDLVWNPGMCSDWEWNWRPLVCRLALNPLSHTSQGGKFFKDILLMWQAPFCSSPIFQTA